MALSLMLFIQYKINHKKNQIIWDKLDNSKDDILNIKYLKQINYLDCKNILIKLIYTSLLDNYRNIDS